MEPHHRVIGAMLSLAHEVGGLLLDIGDRQRLLIDPCGQGRDITLSVDETVSPPRLAVEFNPEHRSAWTARVEREVASLNRLLSPPRDVVRR